MGQDGGSDHGISCGDRLAHALAADEQLGIPTLL